MGLLETIQAAARCGHAGAGLRRARRRQSTFGATQRNARLHPDRRRPGEHRLRPLAAGQVDARTCSTPSAALYGEDHDYRTVVVDSLDWLERMIWDDVCGEFGVKYLEKADGGYGKGFGASPDAWVLDVIDG